MEEVNRHNEILLFSQGPGGTSSALATLYFKLKQEVLQVLHLCVAQKRHKMDELEAENITISETNNDTLNKEDKGMISPNNNVNDEPDINTS